MRIDAGAAYDFRRDPDTGLFSLRTRLTASDAVADEAFGAAVILACDTIIIGAPDADLVGMLIDAGAAFVFQTFRAREDSDGRSSSSGLNCFIDTARSSMQFNTTWCLLGAIIAIALAFLRHVGRKGSDLDRQGGI